MKKMFIGITIGIVLTILVINIYTKESVKNNNIVPLNLDISKPNIDNKKHLISINGTFYINAPEEECRKGIEIISNLYMTLPAKEKNMLLTFGPTSICGEIIPADSVHHLESFSKLTLKQQGALGTLLLKRYLNTPEYKKHLEQKFKK